MKFARKRKHHIIHGKILRDGVAGVIVCLILFTGSHGYAAEDNTENTQEDLLPESVVVDQEQATVVGLDEYPDPLEKVNRAVFAFNDVVYTYVAVPLGNVYEVLPSGVRSGVSRFFLNIREPLNLVNHLAQGRFRSAGDNAVRFATNTVIGIGGIFDPADSMFGIEPNPSGFNDTFTRYGMSSGPFIVLPFLGGTDVRGGAGRVLDNVFHPVRLITDEPDTTYIVVFDNFQGIAPQIDNYVELRKEAEDPYVYFRNQYLQAADRDENVVNAAPEDIDE